MSWYKYGIKNSTLLGVGLFVYKINNDEVTTYSYALMKGLKVLLVQKK